MNAILLLYIIFSNYIYLISVCDISSARVFCCYRCFQKLLKAPPLQIEEYKAAPRTASCNDALIFLPFIIMCTEYNIYFSSNLTDSLMIFVTDESSSCAFAQLLLLYKKDISLFSVIAHARVMTTCVPLFVIIFIIKRNKSYHQTKAFVYEAFIAKMSLLSLSLFLLFQRITFSRFFVRFTHDLSIYL